MRQELPYHLEQLLDNNRLTRCLLEWEVFERLFSEDFSIDLLRSWQKVRENLLLKTLETLKYSIEQRHGWIQWQEIWQNYITSRSHVVTFFGAGTVTRPQILNSVTDFSRRKKIWNFSKYFTKLFLPMSPHPLPSLPPPLPPEKNWRREVMWFT